MNAELDTSLKSLTDTTVSVKSCVYTGKMINPKNVDFLPLFGVWFLLNIPGSLL